MNKDSREDIIGRIVDAEWEMFRSVRSSEPSACQQAEGTFRTMRWMSHSVFPEQVLESYLLDLKEAAAGGRNLMTEKYARMQGIIPPLKVNVKIDEIAAVEVRWMEDLARLHPRTFRGVLQGFRLYEACELETYSDRTIDLYHAVVIEAHATGRNLVEERYTNLFGRLGYSSLTAVEESAGH